jgi:hypothetical protein
MKLYGTIERNDYTIEPYTSHAEISWELVSSSAGIIATNPVGLSGAIMVNVAGKNSNVTAINNDTGIYEYILHKSIEHNFYNYNRFYSASAIVTSSIAPLADLAYVVSAGQNFYGDEIRNGSFLCTLSGSVTSVQDDGKGNLFVSQSGNISYVGNIFYKHGIAVINHNTASVAASITSGGMYLVSGSKLGITFSTVVSRNRHQTNVRLLPGDFNSSPYNPSVARTYLTASGIYEQMAEGTIKPYVTSIGLYNEFNELLAVAKLSTPVQRIFNTQQIFIVRFDT